MTNDLKPAAELRRPASIVSAVLLLAAIWIAALASIYTMMITRGATSGEFAGMTAGYVFWTLLIGLILRRLWRGGPVVRKAMLLLTAALSTVMVAGAAGMAKVLAPTGRPYVEHVGRLVIAAVLFGAVALLLRTRSAKAWSARLHG